MFDMIALPVDPDEVTAALSVLGGTLEPWRDAVQLAHEHSVRDEPYDPELDGPLLLNGAILVGHRHLDLVEFSLSSLVVAARELGLSAMVTRLSPLREAIAEIADAVPESEHGRIAN